MIAAYLILVSILVSLELLLLLMRRRITYRVENDSLIVSSLGLRLKRIPMDQVRKVNKDKIEKTENWSNCFNLHRRRLTLHFMDRKRKPVTITPKHRYVFRSKLESVMEKISRNSPSN